MSKVFKPRLTAPSTSDKNYIKNTKGGLNPCIEVLNGSVMPNCVGYTWGRWRELLGHNHKLSIYNAEVWYGNSGDGYQRSQKPKLGSVICWGQGALHTGADGAGHVAVVEDVKSDGTIITSNSAYKGSRFYLRTLKPPYSMGGNFKFQGFIHPPVDFVKKTDTKPKFEFKDLKIGDVVSFDGQVHYDSGGSKPGITFKGRVAQITGLANGSKFPVHVDQLGWIKLNTLTEHRPIKMESKPDPKPTPKPKPSRPEKNHFGQRVQVGQKITFSYIRKDKYTSKVLRPYYRNKDDRGYGIVKKIHTDVDYNKGAYEVQLDKKNKATIGFVAPINTY